MKDFFINFLKKIDTQLKTSKQSPINNDFLQKQKSEFLLQTCNTTNASIANSANIIIKNKYYPDARSIKLLKQLTDKGYFKSYSIFSDFLKIVHAENINMQIYSAYRSKEEQAVLHTKGVGVKAGQSFHNYGLAIDIIVNNPKTLALKGNEREVAMIEDNQGVWEVAKANEFNSKYGLYWGGLFKSEDTPHFELSWGLAMTPFKKKFDIDNYGKL